MPLLVGFLVLLAVVAYATSTSEPTPPAPQTPQPLPSSSTPASDLNTRLLAETLKLLPSADTVLRPGDAALDPIYGGRRPDAYGEPAWGYYQRVIGTNQDGTPKSGGTTCAITLGYLMSLAGWPADMVNRLPSDPVAPGGGFTAGLPVSKIVSGAKKRGWYLPPTTPLRPGDAYHVDHWRPNSDHVGDVVAVNGQTVETADGGQGRGADVHRNIRVLTSDGGNRTLTLNGVPARLLGVIRATPTSSSTTV